MEGKEYGVRNYQYVVPFDDPKGFYAGGLKSEIVTKPVYTKTETKMVKNWSGKMEERTETKTFLLDGVAKQAEEECMQSLEKSIPEVMKLGYTPFDLRGKPFTRIRVSYIKGSKKFKKKNIPFRYTDYVRILNLSTTVTNEGVD